MSTGFYKGGFCPHWSEDCKNGICEACKMDLSKPREEEPIPKFKDGVEAMKFSLCRHTQEYADLSALRSEYTKLQARNQKLELLLQSIFSHMSEMACCGYSDWVQETCEKIEETLKDG